MASHHQTRQSEVGVHASRVSELTDEIQEEVRRRWSVVETENIEEYGDLKGFREDFLKIFGFGFEPVNYEAETDPLGSEI